MFEPIEEQQQWQLESQLGSCIDCLLGARHEVQEAEEALKRARDREARYLEKIRDYRRYLGLPDEPINYLLADDRCPGSEPHVVEDRAYTPPSPDGEG